MCVSARVCVCVNVCVFFVCVFASVHSCAYVSECVYALVHMCRQRYTTKMKANILYK